MDARDNEYGYKAQENLESENGWWGCRSQFR